MNWKGGVTSARSGGGPWFLSVGDNEVIAMVFSDEARERITEALELLRIVEIEANAAGDPLP